MVPYLDVQHLSKSFGALQLFRDISFMESDDDVRELFHEQEKSPMEIFRDCEKIVRQLMSVQKVRFYAKVNLAALLDALDGWEETEFEVI